MRSLLILVALPLLAHADALSSSKAVSLVTEATNEFRREHHLATLATNDKLARTAGDFAQFMARTGRFAHDADGARPADRARSHGYDYCMVAENIGYQFRSDGFRSAAELANGFIDGWKRSRGHRENMLDREPVEIGVGVARSDSGHYYAVQLFGRPASMRVQFEVANRSDHRVDYRVGSESFSLPRNSMRTHQICASDTLDFHGEALSVRNGDRFAVLERAGRLRIAREGSKEGE
jgi:hypothetical protein